MNTYELKQLRLYRQHLTAPADRITVVRDLCGIQAQFSSNVPHALKIRCGEVITKDHYGDGLVKNWTIRGTIHAFAEEDLPLFKHGRERYHNTDWAGCTTSGRRWALTPERQTFWSEFILQKIAAGIGEREELKALCMEAGMTTAERDCMFEAWGGGMRDLCERGFLNYAVQEKKVFVLSTPFEPMDTPDAEREMLRRYFAHYAPATLRDAAYYFGWSQAKVKEIMRTLPMQSITVDGVEQYYIGEIPGDLPEIPGCILLAGFDPLMLGYRKEDSIFLPPEYLRGIFNLAGIVMPPVLLHGRVAGRWRRKGKKLIIEQFEALSAADRNLVEEEAVRLSEPYAIEWRTV